MPNIKKALVVGAITVTSFPNILFAQEINPTKFKDIDIFSSNLTATRREIVPLPRDINIPAEDLVPDRPKNYLETHDDADKALDRVYKKVNKLLSDMVDEMTRSKNTPPGMWSR